MIYTILALCNYYLPHITAAGTLVEVYFRSEELQYSAAEPFVDDVAAPEGRLHVEESAPVQEPEEEGIVLAVQPDSRFCDPEDSWERPTDAWVLQRMVLPLEQLGAARPVEGVPLGQFAYSWR